MVKVALVVPGHPEVETKITVLTWLAAIGTVTRVLDPLVALADVVEKTLTPLTAALANSPNGP